MVIFWIGNDGIYKDSQRVSTPLIDPLPDIDKPTARSANYANAGGRARNAALPKEVKGERSKLYGR